VVGEQEDDMRVMRLLAAPVGIATFATLGVTAGGAAVAARPGPAGAAKLAAAPRIHPNVFRPRAAVFAGPPTTAQCRAQLKFACYRPGQIQQAYGLPKLYARGINGSGRTIVLVDPFGSPTIRRDLRRFDRGFGLPSPPSFKIIQPAGKVPPYQPTGNRIGWAFETTLDVEYSHTIAPRAKILLVETPANETEGTAGFPQIVKAEEFVIRHHLGDVISQSFGATEQSFATVRSLLALRTAYLRARAAGITVLASTGDSGAANVMRNGSTFFLHPTVSWPSTDPLVTALGGTQLHLNAKGNRTAPDTVWNDTHNKAAQEFFAGGPGPSPLATGGGKSVVFTRPSYQNGVEAVTGPHRGVPDISMSAACSGSVLLYIGPPGVTPGYQVVCGTSEASPEFAGIVALTAQVAHHPLGLINPLLYKMLAQRDPGLVDVTSGNNTVSFHQGGKLRTVKGFAAGAGYDLASGVGTLYGPHFVAELARLSVTGQARR
jgi:subtilase family serine protease